MKNTINHSMILDQMPTYDEFNLQSNISNLKFKEECNQKGMYAFVSWKWINPFAEWIGKRKCLEIMAGAGYLSWALQQKGIDIIATDDLSWQKIKGWQNIIEIEPFTANQAILKYGKQIDILIIAWPYMDDTAYKALRLINYINPNALIVYIGERDGGCTADDNFFINFEEIKEPGFELTSNNYECFWGMRDRILLGKCRKRTVWITEE